MRLLACAATALVLALSGTASAQFPGAARRGPRTSEPKPKAPDADEDRAPLLRAEPAIAPPQDPLLMSPETRERIGSDWAAGPPSPEGLLVRRRMLPYYEATRGDYRERLLPPFFVEETRGLPDQTRHLYGVPQAEDTQGLYGLLYYRRRSPKLDIDLVFPALWRVRDGDSKVVVVGPLAHREAPGEHDNWLAPLLFEGERRGGGYLHAPLLLTTSHWDTEGAFTLVGPYFRARTGTDVDLGVAPLFFRGDNGDSEGNRRTYTLIPPLLFYHAEQELDGTSMTVVGPVVARSNPKRAVFDVGPLFFHIHGKPETGGVSETHTTLFPLFHYGRSADQSLFIIPGYYRRVTPTSDALLSLGYSHIEARSGATSLTAAGPIVPLWWSYSNRDVGLHSWAIAPLFFRSDSPAGHDWLTPLVGRFETYGESRTWWVFPTLTLSSGKHGFENDFHPIVYTGRTDDSAHTVIAPVFWDFASPRGRTTIGFPLYWRFADGADDSVLQVAANTLYVQKRVAGGRDWQFHLLPLFSYGENPNGYFWNVLFGLAGFTREGTGGQVRALWIPIDFGGAPAQSRTAMAR